MLDNDNNGNAFFYDRFEGRVFVGNRSVGNRFELSEFINPTGNLPGRRYAERDVCLQELLPVLLLGRVSGDLRPRHPRPLRGHAAKMSEGVTIKFPGCTADFDLDATVDPNERGVVQAAMGSAIGGPNWNPEADLDHDGKVDTR